MATATTSALAWIYRLCFALVLLLRSFAHSLYVSSFPFPAESGKFLYEKSELVHETNALPTSQNAVVLVFYAPVS